MANEALLSVGQDKSGLSCRIYWSVLLDRTGTVQRSLHTPPQVHKKKGKGEGGYLASIFVGNIEKTKELRIMYTAREEVKYRKAKEDDKSSRVHI